MKSETCFLSVEVYCVLSSCSSAYFSDYGLSPGLRMRLVASGFSLITISLESFLTVSSAVFYWELCINAANYYFFAIVRSVPSPDEEKVRLNGLAIRFSLDIEFGYLGSPDDIIWLTCPGVIMFFVKSWCFLLISANAAWNPVFWIADAEAVGNNPVCFGAAFVEAGCWLLPSRLIGFIYGVNEHLSVGVFLQVPVYKLC